MAKIKRALISVYDKTGIEDFAKVLTDFGVEIISTGKTASILRNSGIDVIEVSDFTGFPEIMEGRLKTIHPKIAGGILGDRKRDKSQMESLNIDPIDMVVVNFYPFSKVIEKKDCDLSMAIENIDIGGPTMVRAAAKNFNYVTVVIDPKDYALIKDELLKNSGVISYETNFYLAKKVFRYTAFYDAVISKYFMGENLPNDYLTIPLEFSTSLRYGENPHQFGAFFLESGKSPFFKKLQGKDISFNNILDLDTAFLLANEFDMPCCVIIKHNNPCGVALGRKIEDVYVRARSCDEEAAFGGIVGFNTEVTKECAKKIKETFIEAVIAPSFEDDALSILSYRKNLIVCIGELNSCPFDFKRVSCGMLVQERDDKDFKELDFVSKRKPDETELSALKFLWKVCKYIKSNAICVGAPDILLGVGAGQMSRVVSTKIALEKAKGRGAIALASDAMIPFRDTVDLCAEYGIKAIIETGGSVRDKDVIKACDEHGIALVFTHFRHFRH